MSVGLLTTKLHAPRPRAGLVQRPRLAERLQKGGSRRLTLVSAPAGSGKTTAVSQWVHAGAMRVAWLSLDEGDNDRSRFWNYLLGAFQVHESGFGEAAALLLRSPEPPSNESLLTALINEVAQLREPWTLVLEDYHVIDNEEIHRGVTYLLDHLPPGLHVTIITRADPALPLARLRGSDDLVELRAADLRFTEEEVVTYLNEAMGLGLSAGDVAALEQRTEGWAAGLQMAALSLRGREDAAALIDSLTGSHRNILDYLAEEVLNRQPEPVRSFLLDTSILGRLSGPLCDVVTAGTDGRETLEMLERENLFLIPLDDDREWYRYHHLFGEFLRTFIRDADRDHLAELHRRASDWFAEQGSPTEAVEHALAASDFERAAALVEQSAETVLWRDSQQTTVLSWMEAIPEELVRSKPQLNLVHAWARFTTGQWDAVEPLLQRAERALDASDGREHTLGEAALIRSGIAYESGEMLRSIELARNALESLPEDAQSMRAVAAFQLGLGSFFVGDLATARESYTEATTTGQLAGNVAIALLAIGCRMQLEVAEGRLGAAAEAYRAAREIGTSNAGTLFAPTGLACVQMGEVLRERNELDAAEGVLREGIELCRQQGGMPEYVLRGYVSLARVLQACEEDDGASAAMRQGEAVLAELMLRPGDVRPLIAPALIDRARWWIARDNLTEAERWLGEQGLSTEVGPGRSRLVEPILRVKVLLARGRHERALDVLNSLDMAARSHPALAAETLMLEALIAQARGDEARAVERLGEALSHAEPEGYVRLFLDEGEPMRRLLLRAVAKSVVPEYSGRLLAAFPLATPSVDELPEPLNERERAVVSLMAAGLSNREIAGELYLSVNTVKWHARNLYAKLGVNRRALAVTRARELSIL